MNLLDTLLVAFGLAMDAFAVAIASGLAIAPLTGRHVFRLAFHFGLFQFLMPVIGWLAGRTVAGYIGAYDHWVALVLLAGIGAKMLYESFQLDRPADRDPTRGLTMVMLSIATSLDALAVGVTMGCRGTKVLLPSLIIGLVAGGMTLLGMQFGNRLGGRVGVWAERAGGIVLISLGVKIALTG